MGNVCNNDLANIVKIIKSIVSIIQILTPICIILLGTLDLFKAVIAQKEDEIKSSVNILVKRFIYGVLVFLLFVIVRFTIGLFGSSDWKNCWGGTNIFGGETEYIVDDIILDKNNIIFNISDYNNYVEEIINANVISNRNKNVITWKSSNKQVAVVDSNGKVTATGLGKTEIIASIENVKSTVYITVVETDTTLSISEKTVTLNMAEEDANGEQLFVYMLSVGKRITDVKWYSSNPKVVEVNNDGIITGKSVGKAMITAKAYNSEVKTEVTVINGERVYIWMGDSVVYRINLVPNYRGLVKNKDLFVVSKNNNGSWWVFKNYDENKFENGNIPVNEYINSNKYGGIQIAESIMAKVKKEFGNINFVLIMQNGISDGAWKGYMGTTKLYPEKYSELLKKWKSLGYNTDIVVTSLNPSSYAEWTENIRNYNIKMENNIVNNYSQLNYIDTFTYFYSGEGKKKYKVYANHYEGEETFQMVYDKTMELLHQKIG